MFASNAGFQGLLKEGGRHFSGTEEATLKNVEACKSLANITQTSFGPRGMNKLIVNQLSKQYVTSDAACMVTELDVVHPAAKLLVMAAKMQEVEFGDGTNSVIMLAGELLTQAEHLIKMGLHTADIIRGYEIASKLSLEYLRDCVSWTANMRKLEDIEKAVSSVVSAKQYGLQNLLSPLIAEATMSVMPPEGKTFDAENIRVSKITGGSMSNSLVVHGMVVDKDTLGVVKRKENCKVAVFSCDFDMTGTETKGTVCIHSAEELMQFTKGEEAKMEQYVKDVADTGVEVLIVGGSVSDVAKHFIDKYNLLLLKISSKHELRRLCKSLNAVCLVRLGAPVPEEIGRANSVQVEEIGSRVCTIIRSNDSRIATILLRGASPNVLDEAERAIDDAVALVKACSDSKEWKFVPGAGATEIQVAHRIQLHGCKAPGLEQYSIKKFGEALEVFPRMLAENAGHKATAVIGAIFAAHHEGKTTVGVNVEEPADDESTTIDAMGTPMIVDHLGTKQWAWQLGADAAITVLKVDQIIMAKPAGGPKPGAPGPQDED
eukprot:GHVL01008653.1.p1 GENE.GHVL01008653.1~~GHVL01008653.1.p1  ORF type:complete len:546 (+),score=96.77 GHVL01008653.1:52-1689(+)